MATSFAYRFAWDAAKARANWRKHRVSFELAIAVFRDPLALSLYDEEHGEGEERWLTLGQVENGTLLVVSHTFEELDKWEARVRIISARRASSNERAQYQSGQGVIGEPMKDEYDFSNAKRGKFYRNDGVVDLPVYLDAGVRDYLSATAKAKGIELNALVNELLKRGIELIKAAN
jgi:uncharacterized DUF497 family protein